jgi:hypothetical protein
MRSSTRRLLGLVRAAFLAVHASAHGTSRHFAAVPKFRRYWVPRANFRRIPKTFFDPVNKASPNEPTGLGSSR